MRNRHNIDHQPSVVAAGTGLRPQGPPGDSVPRMLAEVAREGFHQDVGRSTLIANDKARSMWRAAVGISVSDADSRIGRSTRPESTGSVLPRATSGKRFDSIHGEIGR